MYRRSLGDLRLIGVEGPRFHRNPQTISAPWRTLCVDVTENALVFPSERGTLISRDNFLRRIIQLKLAKIGLGS